MTCVADDYDIHVCDIEAVRTHSWDVDRIVTVCQDDVADNVSEGTDYVSIPLADGEEAGYGGIGTFEAFATAVDAVIDALYRDEEVLVHCHVGRSRSAAVAAAALATMRGETFTKALASIEARREIVNPVDSCREWGRRYVEDKGT